MNVEPETAHTPPEQEPAAERSTSIPGKWVVTAMFAFAITMTGILGVYSYLHAAPFQPLTRAIAAEFPNSAPRVEGGRRKMHENTPSILRIVVRVDFDPNGDDERAAALAERLAALAEQYTDFHSYEQLDVHLYSLEPERAIHERAMTRAIGKPQ